MFRCLRFLIIKKILNMSSVVAVSLSENMLDLIGFLPFCFYLSKRWLLKGTKQVIFFRLYNMALIEVIESPTAIPKVQYDTIDKQEQSSDRAVRCVAALQAGFWCTTSTAGPCVCMLTLWRQKLVLSKWVTNFITMNLKQQRSEGRTVLVSCKSAVSITSEEQTFCLDSPTRSGLSAQTEAPPDEFLQWAVMQQYNKINKNYFVVVSALWRGSQ